jgi:N-acetylornithine carbamoyltransferase
MASANHEATAAGRPQHLTRLSDLGTADLARVLELASRLKAARPSTQSSSLVGRSLGMLFFRGSLRTRVSIEAAMNQLGGSTIELTAASDAWELEAREGRVMDGRAPEHVKDAARTLSRYVDALGVRPAVQGRSWEADRQDAGIAAWARHAEVPVINLESALWHPLQALADLMTLRETHGELKGKRMCLAWVHSTEPASPAVAHSTLHAALTHGMSVRVACPKGFELDPGVLAEAGELAAASGATLEFGNDLRAGAEDCDVVYARSWASLESYGNPTLAASRRGRQNDWRVDEDLMALAGTDSRLMHAMPVRRNLEVTDEVLDGARSLMIEQAANRLHSQKALLQFLLGGAG